MLLGGRGCFGVACNGKPMTCKRQLVLYDCHMDEEVRPTMEERNIPSTCPSRFFAAREWTLQVVDQRVLSKTYLTRGRPDPGVG